MRDETLRPDARDRTPRDIESTPRIPAPREPGRDAADLAGEERDAPAMEMPTEIDRRGSRAVPRSDDDARVVSGQLDRLGAALRIAALRGGCYVKAVKAKA